MSELHELPEEVRIEADGPVRTVVLDRPDELNAVNAGLHRALAVVWQHLAADPEAKVVVLTGAGRAFSAGGDLDWITSFLEDPVARDESIREGAQIIEEMLRFPLPVIAAVNGPAVGLGCSVAVLSDVVLISSAAYLMDPHVAVGLVAGDGGAAFWPLLTPILRTREFLFTGDRIPAATAVEVGLASRVVEPDELLAEAHQLAHRMARQPAEALRGTKRVVNMYLSQALAGPMLAGFAAEQVTMQSAEHRQRLLALRETAVTDDLGEFRAQVRDWCRDHVPPGWREAQTGVPEAEFVRFQQAWFQELRGAGFAVPHWPAKWGGGMSVDRQVVLYQELAAHDAPRLVLAFVAVHHAASTLLAAGTGEQRQRHLPAILDGEIWVQGFSEPGAGSDLAALRTSARRRGDEYVVNGQKIWASGGLHADWCLLLARTDPAAPKRRGISYFLLDMRSPGIEVRPIRQATGESHFCEIFLDDVAIPAANLVGPEHEGWRVAQQTLGAERGMTMLELAERLGNAGFRWLVETCAAPGPDGTRPLDDGRVLDRLGALETEIAGLRALCRRLVSRHGTDAAGPADASIVKLHYSELLQRMTDFGTELAGPGGLTVLRKPLSSGWESGAWALDFIGSWEWTIPGGTSEIQRTIIAERGLGLPREPVRA